MKIQRIAVRVLSSGKRECSLRVAGQECQFTFVDLVEFSDGVQEALVFFERLVPTNIVRPKDRSLMQLESLQVQDSVEHNRNMISGREAAGRRAEGEFVAGGAWYMEVSINGTDSDCSFNTLAELLQIVQQIVKRELATGGQIIAEPMVELARA